MTDEQALGKAAFELSLHYGLWEDLDSDERARWITIGTGVAEYVQREMRAQGFAAFVSIGGMDLDQRIAELEKKQDIIDTTRKRTLQKLLDEALSIDGAHYKQWYLRRIADVLGVRPFESGDGSQERSADD